MTQSHRHMVRLPNAHAARERCMRASQECRIPGVSAAPGTVAREYAGMHPYTPRHGTLYTLNHTPPNIQPCSPHPQTGFAFAALGRAGATWDRE